MNERFIFFSSIGFALALAYGLQQLSTKLKASYVTPAILALIVLPYSVKTIERNKVWENDFTLFTTDAKTSIGSAKCNVSAGGKYYERALTLDGEAKEKMLESARKHLIRGLNIHPKNTSAWILVGNVAFEQKDYTYGTHAYKNCLKLSPSNALAITNIKIHGNNAHANKFYKDCIALFDLLPDSLAAQEKPLYQVADSYLNLNNIDSAQSKLLQLVALHPQSADAYNKLGELYGRYLNNLQQSEVYLRKAYSIDRSNHAVLENLGVLLGMKGQFKASLDFLLKALEAGGSKERIYQNLALTYERMGDLNKAREYATKAKSI